MINVGRNERCPCGSGRRYKECHGAIGAAEPAQSPAAVPLAEIMEAAIRAQRSRNFVEAAALYRRALAADPSNFDATHMLGLIEYESGRFDTALELIRRASDLRPDLGMPRYNLRVLESMPLVEREICRNVLPRLLDRVEPVESPIGFAPSARVVHLVVAGGLSTRQQAALARLVAAFGARPLVVWAKPDASPPVAGARTLDAAAGSHPQGGLLVLCGTAESPMGWLVAAQPERVALVVADEDPCAIIDRIDELFDHFQERPGLLCMSRALAKSLHLPLNACVPEPEPAALSSP